MKTDLFTKIILSVIAAALVGIFLQNMEIIPTPKKDVRIVSIAQPSRANIVQSIKEKTGEWKWDAFSSDEMDVRIVGVEKNIPVEIKEPESLGSVQVEVTNPEDFNWR